MEQKTQKENVWECAFVCVCPYICVCACVCVCVSQRLREYLCFECVHERERETKRVFVSQRCGLLKPMLMLICFVD